MRLSHRDFDAFQRATLELYEPTDLEGFLNAVPGIYRKLIPSDYVGLVNTAVELSRRQIRVVGYWETYPRTETQIPRIEHTAFGHPFTRYSMKTRDPSALKISDFYSLRELRESHVYNEFYRHADIERFLAIAVMTTRGMMTLNFPRRASDRDFTERDRLMLNLLRPHFSQAMRNADRRSRRPVGDSVPLAEYGLSPRESEVATWLGRGKTNLEIAAILGMPSRTVEKHVERILSKLNVENRTAAALVIVRASSSTSRGAPGLPQLPDH